MIPGDIPSVLNHGGRSLLSHDEARREAEEILRQFVILYPTESLVRTAIRIPDLYRAYRLDADAILEAVATACLARR